MIASTATNTTGGIYYRTVGTTMTILSNTDTSWGFSLWNTPLSCRREPTQAEKRQHAAEMRCRDLGYLWAPVQKLDRLRFSVKAPTVRLLPQARLGQRPNPRPKVRFKAHRTARRMVATVRSVVYRRA